MIGTGLEVGKRLARCSQADWEFIFQAVEAGWSTPRIADECEADFATVFAIARFAREEMRQNLRVCERCRCDIARGLAA